MTEPQAALRLTWRAGGWVLLVAALLCAALLVWAFAGILAGHRPQGGATLDAYGFDLSACAVPTDELVPTGEPRDFVRTFEVRESMPATEMLEFNRTHRKRYIVSDDRVLVVALGGETRAYPLSVVQAHEVVQDTLGGVPIAVTYSPFCDAAVVFDRRVGDTTLDLGVSGLVREANTVLYDRQPSGTGESLWQQLDGRAIAGPAATRQERLVQVPGTYVTTWSDYLAAVPSGTVMRRDEGNTLLYQRISYRREHESGEVAFPLRRLSGGDVAGLAPKSRVLVLTRGASRAVVPIDELRGGGDIDIAVPLGGQDVLLHLPRVGGTARIGGPGDVEAVQTFLFAARSLLDVDASEIVMPTAADR